MVFASWTRYAWDFCLAPRRVGDDEPYQLFYLQEQRRHALLAHRRLAEPSAIGRAGSADLVTWRRGPDAILVGEPGAWEAGGFWPGCIVERDGLHHLFYTGRPRGPWRPPHDNPTDVQIGLATSSDLRVWTRHPANPLIVDAGPSLDAVNPTLRLERPWSSDPWVTPAPQEGAYYLHFVARDRAGEDREISPGGGAIVCARSADLLAWQEVGPVTEPGIGGALKALQVAPLDGRFYLLFSTITPGDLRRRRVWPPGDWQGVGYLVADRLTGPYRPLDDTPLLAAPYTGARVVTALDGRPMLLATRDHDDDGRDLGVITDPAPLTIGRDGRLSVEARRLWPAGWRPTNELTSVPAAFVERGLAVGLLTLDAALALAGAASDQPSTLGEAAILRVEYYAAILDGATLSEEQRAAIERAALDLTLTGQRLHGEPPVADFASLALLLPRLTGERRVEAGQTALARAMPRVLRGGLKLALIAAALTPAERTQALTELIGPDMGDEVVELDWVDDEDADAESYGFDEVMALAPHLTGRERRRALVAALREAGRVASNSETFGRGLGARQMVLAEIAPYLVDEDLRTLARAIARASGFAPPEALDWPADRADWERRTRAQQAFLAEPGCQRWLGRDGRMIAGILAALPAAERQQLAAEALDCLWHHRFGYYQDGFLSRGLRGAAHVLSREQVAEQLARCGL